MLPDVPAGLIYSGLRKGLIKVNGRKKGQSYLIQENDVIAVKESINFKHESSPAAQADRKSPGIDSISVLRTENLLILNKPAGMLTHGENSIATLIDNELTGIAPSLSFKPAPLHRLDRNTSGLITVSLTIEGASHFSELIRSRRVKKYYIGMCIGGPGRQVRLSDVLVRPRLKTRVSGSPSQDQTSGSTALTTAETILEKNGLALCLFRIETGLTHQIRAQASAAGFPLAGDKKYSGDYRGFKNYILHAYALSLDEPDDICGFESCFAPLPDRAMKILTQHFGTEDVRKAVEDIKLQINS